MTTQEQRVDKKHSSIILTFSSQDAADRIKAAGYLWVLGQSCGIAEYKSRTQVCQCGNCQGFKHGRTRCTSAPKCAICSLDHLTDNHPCDECPDEARPKCKHSKPKCANCSSSHRADDPKCQVRIKLRSRLEASAPTPPIKAPTLPPAKPTKHSAKPKQTSEILASDLIDAAVEQDRKVAQLKEAMKTEGIPMSGLKNTFFVNILSMTQGDPTQALEIAKTMQKKSPPDIDGMDQDVRTT
jgi:hypothetical protein